MKKAKIMLVAIAVFATVGGALAFKAQKFGNTKYCYTTTTVPPAAADCSLKKTASARAAILPQEENILVYYTSTTDQVKCGELDCPLSGVIDRN